MENEEDFDISAYGVDAEFYVTAGAEPDEDGKYGDYIVSFGDWLAVQESGYQFNCVYGELPSSDDDDEDDEDAEAEREEYIASEKRRLWAEYVVPYIIKGKQISIKQIDFEETRPNEASDPDEPYGRTMDALRSVVMMSQSGEESDAEDGLFLFTFDKDEYFDNDGFAVDDGKLVCYKGTAAEVSIPKGVKTIGGYAFNGCTSLVKLSIPKAVTEIRGGAFEGCTALKEVRYGGTQAEWFMLNAFSGLSENVTVHCSDGDFVPPAKTATEYAIPDSVTEIGSYAFSGCTSLAKVTIPASVTEISSTAFEGCAALKEVRYGGTQMQWFMLKGSRRVPAGTVVHCSDGDTQAEANAADEVVIPEGVTKLDSEMFGDDKSFSKVAIPASVTEIGELAFSGCKSLASVTIPASVTEIGDCAFSACESLVSVTIPASVTEIGRHAFSGCTSLASVTIPEGVTEIGRHVFSGCTSLASVTIPEGVTEIGEYVFYYCKSLASVSIPEGVTKIGEEAFNACTALKEVHYAGTKEQWADVEKGDDWYRYTPAQEVRCSDGTVELPAYRIEDGVLKAWYRGDSEPVIPEGVTKIGDEAFSGCTSLASVTIPEGVTEIGEYAFSGCTALASVSIPASVTTIGEDAFKACTALKEVRYGGTKAQWFTRKLFWRFYGDVVVQCSDGEGISKGMTEVVIPEGVTEIGDRAFYGYTALASVTIPEGVTVIGESAFSDRTALASVTIPGSVTKIGSSAFSGCTALTSVSIPDSVTEIGYGAFEGCTSLAKVTIPEGVSEISSGTFEGCTALKEVRYGGTQAQWFMLNVFKQLPASATVHCSDGDAVNPKTATEYVIPEGVTEIDDEAFKGCTSLKFVTICEGVTKIGTYWNSIGAFEGCTALASVSIPGSVTTIEARAFKGCTALKEVRYGGTKAQWFTNWFFKRFPDDVTVHCSDGDGFSRSMTEVVIPEGVTEIGGSAFEGCVSLTSVTIPEGVTKIGGGSYNKEGAFSGCTALASVSIPASVTEIGGNAFYNCMAIKEIRYGGTQAQWCFMLNGFKSVPKNVTVRCSDGDAQPISKDATEISIPKGVTEIGSSMFSGRTSLVSVSIPEGVTKIGENAFRGCTALASVSIPGSVTEIDDYAFQGCTSLTSVSIPDSVTEIGENAFRDCTSLASVSIPSSVTEIGSLAFYGCTALASVTIPEGVTEIGDGAFYRCTALASVTIPDSVTEIGGSAFFCCKSLISVSIPEGVSKIAGARYGTFESCTSLASVSIPNSVTEIGERAFSGCTSLTSVAIPDSVTAIGEMAFGCTSLASVSIPEGVTEIDKSAFTSTELASVTIPASVTYIGEEAFEDCTSLKEIRYAGTKDQWDDVEKGKNWKKGAPARSVKFDKK